MGCDIWGYELIKGPDLPLKWSQTLKLRNRLLVTYTLSLTLFHEHYVFYNQNIRPLGHGSCVNLSNSGWLRKQKRSQ